MARAPQARAPQASAGDDFYAQEGDEFEQGQGEGRQDGQEGADVPEDPALDPGTKQAPGSEDDLEEEGDDDFIDDPESLHQPPLRGRGEQRIQRLANRNRELEAELARTRQPAPVQQQGPREETDAEFEARIQLLDGAERADARMQRFIGQQQRRDFYNTVQAANTADRSAYTERAQSNPRMARWRDKVEEEFNKRLQMGQAVSRVDLFYWLVGKHMDENPRATSKARDAARERVNRNTVRPSQGGSDVRQGRRQMDERTARAKRLEGQQI